MQLVLGAIAIIIIIGLSSGRFDWRHQSLVVVVAVVLVSIQFVFPRFL
ncbi:MAG TPA: hypothetical protein VI056_06530 [Candidatus Limnocylindria bacterium]